MNIPEKYRWLESIGTLPKLVSIGIANLGLKELPGVNNNNQVIMRMAERLGVSSIYKNDEIAWCALFMCYACKETGKPMPFTSYEILRAGSFLKWGNPVAKGDEKLGDILVFSRPEGSHVALYIAETATTYMVLGGNQGNSVSIMEISKNRLSGARRYYSIEAPASVKKYRMNSSGKVSTNEA